jgi:tRNA(Ile)-lysidine synthase
MRLIRGAGITGLSGFAPKVKFGNISVVRPFYELSSEEIRKYLKSKNVKWREDSSNKDKRHLRNKVRLQLIPYLQKNFNAGIVDTLARQAKVLQEDEAQLLSRTEKLYKKLAVKESDSAITFKIANLNNISAQSSNRLIRHALMKLSVSNYPPEMLSVESIANLVKSGKTSDIVRVYENIVVFRGYKDLNFVRIRLPRSISKRAIISKIESLIGKSEDFPKIKDKAKTTIHYRSLNNQRTIKKQIDELTISMTLIKCTHYLLKKARSRSRRSQELIEFFDISKLQFPLTIRTRTAGDLFQPLGAKGKKKLKEYFIDEKIPVSVRSNIPLVCQGKNVLWIVGHRRSELGKIDEDTRNILKIRISKK